MSCLRFILCFVWLQVQSFVEFFQDDCTDAIHWLSAYNFFSAMTEGWATYVEGELLPQDTNLYTNTLNKEVLLQKYGMIYYQVSTAYFYFLTLILKTYLSCLQFTISLT